MSIYSFKPTYLYIKKHSKTGLLYFGKTTKKDPYAYLGSGTYWKSHIKKYGKEFVETIWVKLFTEEEYCKEYAINFSIENDIVKSKSWANQIIEDGIGLGSPGRVLSEETKEKIRKANSGRKYSDEINKKKSRKGPNNGMFGIKRFGKDSPHYGCSHSKETKEHLSNMAKNREKIECPHCKIFVDVQNSIRWHFDNCKNNPNTQIKILTCPHCGVSGSNNMSRYHFNNCKYKSIV